MDCGNQKQIKNKKQAQTYEFGAFFRTQDLFTQLLNLVETFPIDRLGNNGIYFQNGIRENNNKLQFDDITLSNPKQRSLSTKKFQPLIRVLSPKKSRTFKFITPQRSQRPINLLKTKEEKFDLIEKSIKLARTSKKLRSQKILPREILQLSSVHLSKHPLKLTGAKKYFLKTAPKRPDFALKEQIQTPNKRASQSQTALTNVIQILQKGKNKFLEDNINKSKRKITFNQFNKTRKT